MNLNDVVNGMCQLAGVGMKDVSNIRIRRGDGNQDVFVQLLSGGKKVRAYYDAAKGVINEIDIRQAHERTDSSRLLDMANELAAEDSSMDAFRLGFIDMKS